MPVDLEEALEHLFGADLGHFVAERTRLATALRKEGRRAEAERVKELRKPSLSVWTVNQLARRQRKDIDLLLDAGHRLIESQRALLSGGGDRESFERARKTERTVLKSLVGAARALLAERASPSTLERVASTLRAAAVSEEARPDLARGRLTSDVDLPGFEAFAGLLPATSEPPEGQARPQPTRAARPARESEREAARRDAVSRATADLKAAREHEMTLAKRVRDAERAEREARVRLERVAGAAERLRADHRAAAAAVEAARMKIEGARRS